jgi:hypothetical protein
MYLIHREKKLMEKNLKISLNMNIFIKKNLIFEKHLIISLYVGMGKQIPL